MRLLVIHRPGSMMGGDVIAARDYAAAMRVHGPEVEVRSADMMGDVSGFDWVHIWSANAPHWGLPAAQNVKAAGVRLAITPNWWSRKARLDFYGYHEQDVSQGYTNAVGQTLQLADTLMVCTMGEALECWKLAPYKQVFLFRHGCLLPEDARQLQEPEDYVVCLARIEQHKNQVNLAMACRSLGIPLHLIGSVADESYARQAIALGAKIEAMSRDEAIGKLATARVHALPSFSETPGMSNMEAALLHVPAVMGNIGSEAEFFGYGGIYADPTDWRHIAAGIEMAWKRKRGEWALISTWEVIAMKALEFLELWQ